MPAIVLNNFLALAPGELTQVGNSVFRKQLLRYGRWIHPADSSKYFEVDQALCDKLVENFNLSSYNDFIPVMAAKDQKDPHNFQPTDGVGRIVGLQKDSDGLYALMEFGDQALVEKASKNLIPGVSAGISLSYQHKEKNRDVGPVLQHVVLCNTPYIKNLRGFERVSLSEVNWDVLEFSEKQTNEGERDMNREQLIAEAKKLGIDIVALEADSAKLKPAETQLAETKQKADKYDVLLAENTTLKTKVTELEAAKPDAQKIVELAESVKTTNTENASLRTQIGELQLVNKRTAAGIKVDGLVRAGKVIPAQREVMIELAVKDEPTFTKLTENMPVVVELGERGVAPQGDRIGDGAMTSEKAKAEADRIAGLYLVGKKKRA